MVLTGGVVGLIAGLAAGYDHFRKQPAEYESTAVVTGVDAAMVASSVVLDRAARRLDTMTPFAPPLPGTTSERVAYLSEHLSAQPKDGTVQLAFRGPNPADTAKYLKAVAEAYVAEGKSRPGPTPPLPPAPGAKAAPVPAAPSPTPIDPGAKVATERAKLEAELTAITGEDLPAIESRLTASRTALSGLQTKLKGVDRDLAIIAAAGTDKAARLAAMTQLRVTPDPVLPTAPTAEEKELRTQLSSFQQKKADLGRRLGPEHRDMLALDEQIRFVRETLAKAAAARPTEDALDRHRAGLVGSAAKLNIEAANIAASVERDEATLAAAAPIRAKLDQLAATHPPVAPQPLPPLPTPPPVAVAPPVAPAAPTGPEILSSPAAGERVSPLLYRSLVPGGAFGLVGGVAIGFLASVVAGAAARRPKRETSRSVAAPKPVVMSGTVRRTGTTRVTKYDGPPLSVPVLGSIPALKLDLPIEKKSIEGWSPALVCFSRPNGPEADAYRNARRALVEALGSAGHKAVVVTSPGDGDGKTTTAANLALSLAQSGKRVLLVDCDYRGTKQQELFRVGRLGDSLKSILMNDVDLRVAVRSCEVANLFLLPAGRNPVDGVDLLTRAKFKDLVAELKAQYEYVILDAPPTTSEKELKALAEQADGMVLVVRNAVDAPGRVATATSEIARAGSRVIGAIVTAAPVRPAAPAVSEQPAPTAV